ncbi:MAG: IS110 family transposase [Terriglobia bacterium]
MDSIAAGPSKPSDAAGEPFRSLTHFGGFDWAMDEHQFAVVSPDGSVLLNLRFTNDAEGWAQLRARIAAYPRLGVAIETSCGPAVERLLESGVIVYPLNPKVAERFRDRKSPAGVKNDPLDAWCFADALRTDGQGWRALRPLDPLTAELRIYCRDEIALIEQRTAMILQLRAALHEYYPTALAAFDDWTHAGTWDFVLSFATPDALVKAGKRKWEKFLHAHKLYRPQTAQKRLDLFAKATEFASPSQAVTNAKSLLAITLARQLRTLQAQLDEYRNRIMQLFSNHPDRDCFGSLPGAGAKIAPRLLSELGNDRARFDSHEALQAYAGTAPVTQQSGKRSLARMRRACNKTLRATVHLWADLSRPLCAWAQAYYQQKKNQGMGHAAALRCLGQRWLKILWKMWHSGKPYDEALHTRNQVSHGSWVIGLMTPPLTPTTQ